MAAKKTTSVHAVNDIPQEERARLISEAAYFRAVNRGFTNGSPESDWLAAEQEVDAMLASVVSLPTSKKKAS